MKTADQGSETTLRSIRRRAVDASGEGLVDRAVMHPEQGLPLVFTPRAPGLNLVEWMKTHREELQTLLLQHGALLFRGFEIAGSDEFERCIVAGSGASLEYKFRASPRTTVGGNIYTSTDYPHDQVIFPHNEHSYSPVYPLHLYFYCDMPSPTGGATPLGATRRITRRVPQAIVEKFVDKGILYVRNYGDGFGLPWPTVFQTEDRAEVERYCESVGIEPVWKPGNRLMTRQVGPAMVDHPQTGEPLWFNHGTFFHVTTLPDSVQSELTRQFGSHDLPQNTFYGDGSEIEPETLEQLRAIYRDEMTAFLWQRGDVVWLDNMLTVHGRDRFTGPRRVLTGMAQAQTAARRDNAMAGH